MIDISLPVQLTKVAQQNRGPLPEAYWLRGHLYEPPTVGHTLRVLRYERARQKPEEPESVKVAGLYASSPVREIIENEDGSVTCITANSHWTITQLGLDTPTQPGHTSLHAPEEGHTPSDPASQDGA